MKKKRLAVYIIILLLLGIVAVWTFYPADDLKELKEIEIVQSGTDDAVQVVLNAAEAVRKKDRKLLAKQMFSQDNLEIGIITEPLWHEEFAPVEVIGVTRKVRKSGALMVHVRSIPRKRAYCFSVVKNSRGEYKIQSIGSSSGKLEKK